MTTATVDDAEQPRRWPVGEQFIRMVMPDGSVAWDMDAMFPEDMRLVALAPEDTRLPREQAVAPPSPPDESAWQ